MSISRLSCLAAALVPMLALAQEPAPALVPTLTTEAVRARIAEAEAKAVAARDRAVKLENQIQQATDPESRARVRKDAQEAHREAAGAKLDVQYYQALEVQMQADRDAGRGTSLKSAAANEADAERRDELALEAAELAKKAADARTDAMKRMQELAPAKRTGHGRAHLWIASQLYRHTRELDGKPTPPPPSAILDAESHLLRAVESPDEDVRTGAQFGLAKIYRDTNRIEDARKYLLEVAKRHPQYRLTLANWSKQQNEPKATIVDHAKAAEAAYRERLKASVDDHDARFGLIECLLHQDQFDEARAAINKGATLATEAELVRTYARKLVWVLIQQSDARENDPKHSIEDRLTLLQQASDLDSENPELLNRLVKMMKPKAPDVDKARALFERLLDGKNSATAHLFRGIESWQRDDMKETRRHWEKALEASNGAPLVANNLAWVLAFSPPEDLPRALKLADAAVKKVPEEARFRGTRGHILAKLGGRDRDALADLEKAIVAYPNDAKLFNALADVSTRLGLQEKVTAYRKKAQEFESTKPGDKPPSK